MLPTAVLDRKDTVRRREKPVLLCRPNFSKNGNPELANALKGYGCCKKYVPGKRYVVWFFSTIEHCALSRGSRELPSAPGPSLNFGCLLRFAVERTRQRKNDYSKMENEVDIHPGHTDWLIFDAHRDLVW